jgi:hypothetical protein
MIAHWQGSSHGDTIFTAQPGHYTVRHCTQPIILACHHTGAAQSRVGRYILKKNSAAHSTPWIITDNYFILSCSWALAIDPFAACHQRPPGSATDQQRRSTPREPRLTQCLRVCGKKVPPRPRWAGTSSACALRGCASGCGCFASDSGCRCGPANGCGLSFSISSATPCPPAAIYARDRQTDRQTDIHT